MLNPAGTSDRVWEYHLRLEIYSVDVIQINPILSCPSCPAVFLFRWL